MTKHELLKMYHNVKWKMKNDVIFFLYSFLNKIQVLVC